MQGEGVHHPSFSCTLLREFLLQEGDAEAASGVLAVDGEATEQHHGNRAGHSDREGRRPVATVERTRRADTRTWVVGMESESPSVTPGDEADPAAFSMQEN